jgi:hypothetical protein
MFNVPSFFGFRSGAYGFTAEYQAVLSYATTQGYTLPSASQQVLQNQLVIDLKAAGIWNKLDTFGVFATDAEDSPGSNTSDFALIDWIRLSQYTAINSPTFTTNQGFKGNGTSSYIDINYNALTNGVNFTQNDASFGFYQYMARTTIGISENNFGTGAFPGNYVRPIVPARFAVNNSSLAATADATYLYNNIQFTHVNRNNSAQINPYVDGVSLGPKTAASVGLSTSPFFVFKNSASIFQDSGISIIFVGGSLSSESLNFYNAINTYLTSI